MLKCKNNFYSEKNFVVCLGTAGAVVSHYCFDIQLNTNILKHGRCNRRHAFGRAAAFDRQTAIIKKHKTIMIIHLDSIVPVFLLSADDINSDGHLAFQVNSVHIVGIDSDRVDTHLFGAVLEFVHQSHNILIAARNA